MPPTLQPNAAGITVTYYEVFGITEDIKDLKPKSPGDEVAGVWVSILGDQFPPTPIHYAPEEKSELGFSDLAVYHRMRVEGRRDRKHRFIVIVQYKGAKYESQEGVWDKGEQRGGLHSR